MTFEEILDHAIAMLQRRGRLTYSTLKRQFQLDDAALENLKNELIAGQRLVVDEQGNVLVWTGAEVSAPPAPTPRASTEDRAPRSYTPTYLAEKILTSKDSARSRTWGAGCPSFPRTWAMHMLCPGVLSGPFLCWSGL
jgi:hypothetical protein